MTNYHQFLHRMAVTLALLIITVFEIRAHDPLNVHVGLINIVEAKSAQDELQLNDEMKQRIAEFTKTFSEESNAIMKKVGPGATVPAQNRPLFVKYEAELKKLLSPNQFVRLQQIKWQIGIASALTDPELVQQLALSQEQQGRVRKLLSTHHGKVYELTVSGGSIQDLIQQRDKELDEVLSQEQRARFAQLKGNPFDVTPFQSEGPRGTPRGQKK